MSASLPRFKKVPFDQAHHYAATVFTNPHVGPTTFLRKLIPQDDGHFRAYFAPEYFILPAGQTAPSKSQWNTLKKKMKRHHGGVFIFRAHGSAPCDGQPCYTVDFGFFAD